MGWFTDLEHSKPAGNSFSADTILYGLFVSQITYVLNPTTASQVVSVPYVVEDDLEIFDIYTLGKGMKIKTDFITNDGFDSSYPNSGYVEINLSGDFTYKLTVAIEGEGPKKYLSVNKYEDGSLTKIGNDQYETFTIDLDNGKYIILFSNEETINVTEIKVVAKPN